MRVLLILLCCISIWGQTLPRTEAGTLSGRTVTLPDVLGGKPVVVVFSFSKGAGEKTAEWVAALSKDGAPMWSAAMLDRSLCLYAGEKAWRAALGWHRTTRRW